MCVCGHSFRSAFASICNCIVVQKLLNPHHSHISLFHLTCVFDSEITETVDITTGTGIDLFVQKITTNVLIRVIPFISTHETSWSGRRILNYMITPVWHKNCSKKVIPLLKKKKVHFITWLKLFHGWNMAVVMAHSRYWWRNKWFRHSVPGSSGVRRPESRTVAYFKTVCCSF